MRILRTISKRVFLVILFLTAAFFRTKIFKQRLNRSSRKQVVDLRQPSSKKGWFLAGGALVLAFFLIFFVNQFFSHAEVSYFYPSSCLGEWEGTTRAQEKPENWEKESQVFSADNAAYFSFPEAKIFCGNFLGSDFKGEGEIKRVKLTLVWDFKGEQVGITPLIQNSEELLVKPEDEKSVAPEENSKPIEIPSVTPEENSVPVENPILESPPSGELKENLNLILPDVPPGDGVNNIEEPILEAVPSVYLKKSDSLKFSQIRKFLWPKALAQSEAISGDASLKSDSVIIVDTPADISESVGELPKSDEVEIGENLKSAPSSPESDSEAANASSNSILDPETNLPVPIIHTLPFEPSKDFLSLNYSIDGQTWTLLNKVNLENWKYLTVELPILNWEDLRRLQISVNGIPSTLQKLPEGFLDGLVLGVDYESAPIFEVKENRITQEPAQEVVIPDNLPVITVSPDQVPEPVDLDRKSYGPGETPSFDFDLEKLPGGEPSSYMQPIFQREEIARFSPPDSLEQSFSLKKLGRAFLSWAGLRAARAEDGVLPGKIILDDSRPVVAQILNYRNEPTLISPVIFTVNNRVRISAPEPERSFQPGKYKLKLWILKNNKVYLTETEFIWGVLAINFNKSIYKIGDTGRAGMVVLDDGGHTVCDAELKVNLESPSGKQFNFSTHNGTIIQSSTCGPDNITSEPDYYFDFLAEEEGIYHVTAKVILGIDEREVKDDFEVQANPIFEVERIGPTRIFPPASYGMVLRIKANQDFDGEIREFTPSVFNVATEVLSDIEVYGNVREIKWKVELKAGEIRELKYDFKAPDISPWLYKLGPASFSEGGEEIFKEVRKWQIAADAVLNDGSLLAYGDAADDSAINYRILTSTSTWGAETAAATTSVTGNVSDIKHVVVKAAPTRNEFIIGQLMANGRLDIRTRSNGNTWKNLATATSSGNQICDGTFGSCNQAFDLAYEQLSGRALMVYASSSGNGETVLYKTWDGNASSSESSFAFTGGALNIGPVNWIRLVPRGDRLTDQRSNEMLLLFSNNQSALKAAIWDGTQFDPLSTTTLATNLGNAGGRGYDGAWETNSGDIVVVYSSSTANTTEPFFYKRRVDGVWDSTGTAVATVSSSVGHWVMMAADPNSNRLAVGLSSKDTSAAVNTMGWPAIWKTDNSTAGWTLGTGFTSLEARQAVGVVTGWERYGSGNSTSSALFTFNIQATADTADYETWISGTGFSATADIPDGWTNDGNTRKFTASPNNDELMWFGVDSDNDLRTQRWDGSTWGSTSTELSTAVGTSTNVGTPQENNAFDFAYVPYSAWSLNWRWYSGTSTADTPSPALAAENTSTTNVNAASGQVRLRFNVAELGGNSQTDSRKKLQFTTSTAPDASSTVWTNVGNISSSTEWRYFDCDTGSSVCNDGTALGATVLSSSTATSTWITSWNAATSTAMDHASTTVAELEFPIEANGATAGQLYYFRMYDVGQVSPVYRQQTTWPATPCASAIVCSYPSLQIATNPNPSVTSVVLNGASHITLTPNATTSIYVNFTVTDSDGCSDVFTSGNATTTVYRTGVGSSCSADARNCYITSTSTHNCLAGTSANATATVDIYYFAEPTDSGAPYDAQNWYATVFARDAAAHATSTTSTVSTQELNTLAALEISTSSLDYGTISPNANSGAINQTHNIKNAGNATTTPKVSGTALVMSSNVNATTSQHYATSTFIYGGSEPQLPETATVISGGNLSVVQSSSSGVGAWTNTTALPAALNSIASAVYKNYIYVLGGTTSGGGAPTSTSRYAQISSDGTIGSWTNTTPLPASSTNHRIIASGDRIYLIGGRTANGTAQTTARATSINSDGTLGLWGLSSQPLPSGLKLHAAAVYRGIIYILGGTDIAENATSTVISSQIGSDGTFGSWSNQTVLPTPINLNPDSAAVNNDYLYVLGDTTSTSTKVYYAPISSTGTLGSWVTAVGVPGNSNFFDRSMVAKNNYLYVSGGVEIIGETEVSTSSVFYAPINSNGSVSNWFSTTVLPVGVGSHASLVNNGYLYVVGGNPGSGTTVTTTVRFAPITNGTSTLDLNWGLGVDTGKATGTYSGTITFTAN